jgi:predicted site-specific integrase-resolvase
MSKNEKSYVSIKEASSITGLNQQTLRKLADTDSIESYKIPSGQRKFSRDALNKLVKNENQSSKLNFIYSRISPSKPLRKCCEEIEEIKKKTPKYANYAHVIEQDSSDNINTSAFLTIMDACLNNNIGEVVIYNKENITYLFFNFVEMIILKSGGQLTIINNEDVSTEHKKIELDKIMRYYNK